MGFFDRFRKKTKYKNKKKNYSLQTESLESDYTSNQSVSNFIKKFSFGEEEKIKFVSSLTPREKDVYLLLIEGFTLKEIAKQLGLKYSTVNTHMTQIYRKLKVKSKAELIINYRNVRQ
ncbi:MAG: helix-turn-helix transcriptional regulator [Clostridiaceae bacterium]|nr:helix-turn-helix transcriptional regulator [Clostridiaceae bacterium]